MQEDTLSEFRRLLPRWRALTRTPSHEVVSASLKKRTVGTAEPMARYLKRWDHRKGLIEASDVIDAAIATGNYVSALPAAMMILKDENAQVGLKNAAKQLLGHVPDRPLSPLSLMDEWDEKLLFPVIAHLKKRLSLMPRDALTAIEIARLQSQVGQRKSAVRYVEHALAAAPNDRYVLRSAVNFFSHKSVKDYAPLMLRAISSSDVVRVDPWVQAAEIAIARVCNRSPKWAVRGRKSLDTSGRHSIRFSELASGLALLELSAGSPKRAIGKLLRISVEAPTENALAQAVWSNNEIGFNLDISDHLRSIKNAYEARARAAFEVQNYALCMTECWEWLQDQHLSPTAAIFGSFVAAVVFADYPNALRFAEFGLKANPNQPGLLNSKLVALALGGRAKEASALLTRLAPFEHNPSLRPFYFAAHGLVSFRLGNFAVGREMYARAIEAGKASSRPQLAANAAMYWVEQELMAGTMAASEARQVTSKLDEIYQSKEYGSGKSVAWNARRNIIATLIRNAEMKQEVLQQYSNSAPVPGPPTSNGWVSSLLLS